MSKPAIQKTDRQLIRERQDVLKLRDGDPAYATAPVIDPYARISKNPLTGEMEKTDRQLADILLAMIERGYRLGVIHRDDNISAFKRNAKRPGWLALLARVESGECAGVMCWNLDRLVRQPWDLEILIRYTEQGTGFIADSCFATYSLTNDSDVTCLRILVTFFNAESRANSRRQKRKQQARRDAGIKQNGNRAMGHPGAGASPETLTAERAMLRKGVSARLAGASLKTIVDMWNGAGVTTPSGNKWTTSSVQSTLKLARHAGLAEYNGEILGKAENLTAIITPEQFYALRALNAGRKTPTGSKIKYPLSGVVLCGRCAHPMVIGAAAKGRQVYRCPSPYSRAKACGKTYIAQEAAEQQVRAMVLERLSDPEHTEAVTRKSAELNQTETELGMWTDVLTGITTERTERMGTADPMTPAEYTALRAPALANITRLTAIRDGLIVMGAHDDRHAIESAKLALVWDKATVDEKQRLIRNAFRDGIEILPRDPAAKPGRGSTQAADRIRERQPETAVTSDVA